MKFTFKLFILLLTLAACSSGEDAVQDALDKIPPPPEQGLVVLKPTNIPKNIPGIDNDVAYYGYKKMSFDKEQTFELVGNEKHKTFDIEFVADKSMVAQFVKNSTQYTGNCQGRAEQMLWFEMGPNNQVTKVLPIIFSQPLDITKGTKYLLRVGFENVQGCQTIYKTLQLSQVGNS